MCCAAPFGEIHFLLDQRYSSPSKLARELRSAARDVRCAPRSEFPCRRDSQRAPLREQTTALRSCAYKKLVVFRGCRASFDTETEAVKPVLPLDLMLVLRAGGPGKPRLLHLITLRCVLSLTTRCWGFHPWAPLTPHPPSSSLARHIKTYLRSFRSTPCFPTAQDV